MNNLVNSYYTHKITEATLAKLKRTKLWGSSRVLFHSWNFSIWLRRLWGKPIDCKILPTKSKNKVLQIKLYWLIILITLNGTQ